MLLPLLLALAQDSVRAAPRDTAPIAALERFIVAQLSQHAIPGLAIAVVDGDRIVWAKGFGRVDPADSTRRVTAETPFRVGSVSKLFTDSGVMQRDLLASLGMSGASFAPDSAYRWLASPAIDKLGNIGIGYSFGGALDFPGQRFAGRSPGDPKGVLTFGETMLATGEASQTATLRWEDYTQTAVDPSDDCTVWYVGDYLRAGATRYSSRIGAFTMPGCGAASAQRTGSSAARRPGAHVRGVNNRRR